MSIEEIQRLLKENGYVMKSWIPLNNDQTLLNEYTNEYKRLWVLMNRNSNHSKFFLEVPAETAFANPIIQFDVRVSDLNDQLDGVILSEAQGRHILEGVELDIKTTLAVETTNILRLVNECNMLVCSNVSCLNAVGILPDPDDDPTGIDKPYPTNRDTTLCGKCIRDLDFVQCSTCEYYSPRRENIRVNTKKGIYHYCKNHLLDVPMDFGDDNKGWDYDETTISKRKRKNKNLRN